ncbi:DUF3168 domain-containing protein [Dyadobacter sp. CY312]|uniref:tail completion protein gp17 n=1 Tax=Dyadobacter sp. CY312 TaxID=2907303 RepID=UPI001F187642|nr:DUF3168 domain-containing protein [Dyadobacter sp. CY312]MCE7038991.1 DUF3168 domain-containing protein [Dyadobacter sp. CY312]
MITTAIIQKLVATPELTAIVGDRINPNIIKANSAFPAIYVFCDRMEKQGCYDAAGVKEGVVEIGVFAKSYNEARLIIQAIRTALDDFTGIVNNVGLLMMRGKEVSDEYDEKKELHIKVIEFDAVAEPK